MYQNTHRYFSQETVTTVRNANFTEQFVVCTDYEAALACQINTLEDAKKRSKSRT